MRLRAPVLVGGFAVLALGVGLLAVRAADDNGAKDGVLKLAGMVEKGDPAVKKTAEDVAKEGLNEAMTLLKLRSKDGLGFGAKAGKDASKDGIEAKIIGLAKKELTKAEIKEQAADLEKSAYITAAIAHVTDVHTPKKKVGDKDPKEWMKSTEDMKQSSMDLAAAAKKGDTAAVKKAATKLNSSCNNCHGIFRD